MHVDIDIVGEPSVHTTQFISMLTNSYPNAQCLEDKQNIGCCILTVIPQLAALMTPRVIDPDMSSTDEAVVMFVLSPYRGPEEKIVKKWFRGVRNHMVKKW